MTPPKWQGRSLPQSLMVAAPLVITVWITFYYVRDFGLNHAPSLSDLPIALMLAGATLLISWWTYGLFLATRGRATVTTELDDSFPLRIVETLRKDQAEDRSAKAIGISGEGQPAIYSKKVLHEMRRYAEALHTASIRLIVGPVLLLHPDNPEVRPPLVKMADEGLLTMYIPRRRVENHFISTASGVVYMEKPHLPHSTKREGIFYKYNPQQSHDAEKYFNKLLGGRDADGKRKVEIFDSEGDQVIFMTVEDLDCLVVCIGGPGRDPEAFNRFTVEDLRSIATREAIPFKELGQLRDCAWS